MIGPTQHQAPLHWLCVNCIAAPSAFALLAVVLAGCGDKTSTAVVPTPVRVQAAEITSLGDTVTLTGEIKAAVQSELSFRFAGRIAKRNVDVGDHVKAGQILAVLETNEQSSDVSSATAGVQAAEAALKQAISSYERQKNLIAGGFTTRSNFDNAKQALDAARAELDGAKASRGTATDQLANAYLRADAPGIVIERKVEAGQVVDAAQTVFIVAQDGRRDAVFDVYEGILMKKPTDTKVEIILVADSAVRTIGTVREISPAVDPSTGTVRVKIGIEQLPSQMGLGAAVAGVGRFQPRNVFVLPWTAFATEHGKPAVWIVNPQTHVAALKRVSIESYRAGDLVLRDGLQLGDLVVTAGGQLLHPGSLTVPQPTKISAQAGNVK